MSGILRCFSVDFKHQRRLVEALAELRFTQAT
jgi:hypothetical protein